MAKTGKTPRSNTRSGPRRALASLPDGDGAQTVILVAGPANKPIIALALLQLGQGITDVDLAHCHDRNEAAAILRQSADVGAFDVPPETARTLLAAALAEASPADGWDAAASAIGFTGIAPEPISGQAWLDRLDGDGTAGDNADPGDSANWPDRHPMVATWVIPVSRLSDLDAEADDAAVRAAAWATLRADTRGWAETMLRCALLLHGAGADWRSFAAAARALLGGRDPAEVAIFARVVDTTVAAVQTDAGGDDGFALPADGGGPPAEPGELERLLHRAGGEGDAEWLDGYLAGIELAPHPVPAETWAGRLISAPELLRDRAAAQRLADLALQRHDGLLECLETPQDVRDSVRATGDAGLAAWARGFLQATEAYPDAWPAETLSPSDREMLSALAALGRNGAPVPDRTALADWLIGRAGQ